MFKTMSLPLDEQRPVVDLFVDGRRISARDGETLAVALLNAEVVVFRRTPVSGQARAPLCLMGVCFDCLVEVDGAQNVQSCMVRVEPGMQVRLPNGARRPGEPQ
jgi:predicted molibdopterin-dependent oxidoreductase YjgC